MAVMNLLRSPLQRTRYQQLSSNVKCTVKLGYNVKLASHALSALTPDAKPCASFLIENAEHAPLPYLLLHQPASPSDLLFPTCAPDAPSCSNNWVYVTRGRHARKIPCLLLGAVVWMIGTANLRGPDKCRHRHMRHVSLYSDDILQHRSVEQIESPRHSLSHRCPRHLRTLARHDGELLRQE